MKQIVDFEQAKRLKEVGVFIENVRHGFNENGNIVIFTSLSSNQLPAPTIGELIEWINDNSRYAVPFTTLSHMFYKFQISYSGELIDGLVELAIKIKESQ